MKGVFNNQGRKSGGYKKERIYMTAGKFGDDDTLLSLPCFEKRCDDCNSLITYLPKGMPISVKCACKCHSKSYENK